jgi:hypothetical protein
MLRSVFAFLTWCEFPSASVAALLAFTLAKRQPREAANFVVDLPISFRRTIVLLLLSRLLHDAGIRYVSLSTVSKPQIPALQMRKTLSQAEGVQSESRSDRTKRGAGRS